MVDRDLQLLGGRYLAVLQVLGYGPQLLLRGGNKGTEG